ncbi:glycoside hydrolase family 28 protein [Bradyrhizobium ottawaense]|uniref:glycoside hydrolase family 28 protein n=1 Tax=Bradyrhizobium ottawaense TaxID=931866 RepID=UPI003FA0AA99
MTDLFRFRAALSTVAAIALCSSAQAQDQRTVAEPVAPGQICARLVPSSKNDTARLQDAIAKCPIGAALYLEGGVFLSGPLEMKSGVTLWIERNATLFAIPEPIAYDRGLGSCGTIDQSGDGCRPFISFSGTHGGGIYGEGIIDGAGGAVQVGRSAATWWHLTFRSETEGGKQNVPRLIQIDHANDITLHGITLRNAPSSHVTMNAVEGATLWGVAIHAPANARKTDGILSWSSRDVTIIQSSIRTGGDNVTIGAGDDGPTRHVSIIDNYFGWGHGMSINNTLGSGVSDILVRNLTLDGTTWGMRITSDRGVGGVVEKVTYENVRLHGNRWPIVLDTNDQASGQGNGVPIYRQIVLRHVRGDDGALVMRGPDPDHPLEVTLDDVRFSGSANWQLENAHVTVGSLGVSPPLPHRPWGPVPRPTQK